MVTFEVTEVRSQRLEVGIPTFDLRQPISDNCEQASLPQASTATGRFGTLIYRGAASEMMQSGSRVRGSCKIMAYNGGLHVRMEIHMDNTVGSLTKHERSVIIGSLLGDGYMRIIPGRSDAFLEINHSIKARDYVDSKYFSLRRICTSPPKERSSGIEGRRAYRFFTNQIGELTRLHKRFYKNGEKIIPTDLTLDPLILAIWYMDDGSQSRASDIYLNTQQFSLLNQKRLLHKLRALGISARLNKDKKYYRIRILKESIPHFMKLIKKHIVPSMRYKLVMTP